MSPNVDVDMESEEQTTGHETTGSVSPTGHSVSPTDHSFSLTVQSFVPIERPFLDAPPTLAGRTTGSTSYDSESCYTTGLASSPTG